MSVTVCALLSWAANAKEGKLNKITAYHREDNGDIVIGYGDIKKIVTLTDVDLLRKAGKESSVDEYTSHAVGAEQPVLAEDGQTLGWLVDYDNCQASYACPYILVIYRHGKILRTIEYGRFIWAWKFLKRGAEVAFSVGYPHGDPQTSYALYNVQLGRVIAKADEGDSNNPLPQWTQGMAR